MGALEDMATVRALQTGRIAPPIEKENDLLLFFKTIPDGISERSTDEAMTALGLGRLPHVDQMNDGKNGIIDPALEQDTTKFMDSGIVERLHRGGGRAEEHAGPLAVAPQNSHIPGMIAWCLFLLVTPLMLLIDYDQSQVMEGGEEGRSGTDHDPGLSLPD
jgi:hypothetical protein